MYFSCNCLKVNSHIERTAVAQFRALSAFSQLPLGSPSYFNWCGRFPWTLIEVESRSSADRRVDRLVAGHSPSAGVSNAGHLVCSPPPKSCSSGEQSARRPFQPGTGFQSATWVWSKQHRPDACLFKVWNDPSRSAGLD